MRILHIAPIGRHAEGIGTVLQSIVPYQNTSGNDVRIVSLYENCTYPQLPITTIVKLKPFEAFIRNWTPDIVIFHSVFHLKYGLFYRVLQKNNIPYLIQLHGALSVANYSKNTIKKKVALFLWIKKFIQYSRSIIYLNQAEYNNSIVPNINPRYTIIPNGCNRQNNIDDCKKIGGNLNIVFIGRIAYNHKGLDVLIDALKKLEARNVKGYHVTFYGNEDDIDVMRLKNDIESLNTVSYGGGVYGKRKDKILRDADIFLLTSRYEGMPMGVLEAWSYGIPCILTSGTNMVSQNQDADCYWFTTLDSEDIATTMMRAIELYKKNPQKYRAASFEESKKYEWSKIGELSLNLYSQMIERSKI